MPGTVTHFIKRLLAAVMFALVIMLFSCKHKTAIPLEKVHETSEYLNCYMVFSDTRKSIVEMNEILIQTGKIDTLEDTTVMAAVIHYQGKEIILNRTGAKRLSPGTEEDYAKDDYRLKITYEPKDVYSTLVYKGTCELWIDEKHYLFDVEGITNNL